MLGCLQPLGTLRLEKKRKLLWQDAGFRSAKAHRLMVHALRDDFSTACIMKTCMQALPSFGTLLYSSGAGLKLRRQYTVFGRRVLPLADWFWAGGHWQSAQFRKTCSLTILLLICSCYQAIGTQAWPVHGPDRRILFRSRVSQLDRLDT